MKVSGWGNFPMIDASVFSPSSEEEVVQCTSALTSCVIRGNGRSYGDAALYDNVVSTLRLDTVLHFDATHGKVQCESGVLIGTLLKMIVPQGYFLPVVPGTQHITVGGAIAADIHGKNHHLDGTIANFVESMDILLADGNVVTCSANENANLFWNTFGGMGLTGFILRASLRLRPIKTSYVVQETIKCDNLAETMRMFETSSRWRYTVAWLDALKGGMEVGRSMFSRGEHAAFQHLEKKAHLRNPLAISNPITIRVPQIVPSVVINKYGIQAFNALYYGKQRQKAKRKVVHFNRFFFPLDAITDWNNLYGKEGFLQYQMVIPYDYSTIALGEIISKIHQSKAFCTLAVLKKFGDANPHSPLSFPLNGYTLALDFKRSPAVFELLELLDDIVSNYEGRIYLAKDSRLSAKYMEKFYPGLKEATSVAEAYNPKGKFRSMLSDRLGLTR